MGLFDKLFKKEEKTLVVSPNKTEDIPKIKSGIMGNIEINSTKINDTVAEQLKKLFYAIDVETTGLSPEDDKIIEIGIVKVENGEVTDSFNSLVNPNMPIPKAASRVNHITDDMVKDAPKGNEVFSKVSALLEDVIHGNAYICAHNASFDMKYLAEALMLRGFNGTINYVDTLSFSRRCVKDLPDYTQDTLCKYFGIVNDNAHRALDDAIACSKLLLTLLPLKPKDRNYKPTTEQAEFDPAKTFPSEKEMIFCAYVQQMLKDMGEDIKPIRFYKNSSGYVDIRYNWYDIVKIKNAKKGTYIILLTESLGKTFLPTEECTSSEGTAYTRVFFKTLEELSTCKTELSEAYKKVKGWASWSNAYNDSEDYQCRLTDDEVKNILASVSETEAIFESDADIKAREKAEQDRIKEEQRAEKARRKEIRDAEKAANAKPKGRAILQMDDDMRIIKQFTTISEAVNETGINSKSIRDAANGVQKHAGGFVWKFADSDEE